MNTIVAPQLNSEPCAKRGGSPLGEFYSAADIARATGTNKKKVHRTAARENWPQRANANRIDYCPPPQIARIIIESPIASGQSPSSPSVKFVDLSHSDTQRDNVLLREKAVLLVKNNLCHGKEMALQLVSEHFAKEHPLFPNSPGQLRRWFTAYQANGIDGLVEQKRGRVGRKAFALDLTDDDVLKGRAAAVEHGIKGRTNVARAFRMMTGDPTISGPARSWLHGARASKSSVPPSVRDALRVNPQTTKLIQIGPKAMKLDGAYTECHYENTPAGKAFTADDMTANVYVWCEWPNEQGFLLIRPQILAAMDVGTMAWLTMRAIIRPKGQYNRDDVWGLIGDVMDNFGRFDIAVLEGGTWQSSVVIGHKTSFDDATRFGGLRSLGVKVIHTRTPRGKIIETAFNSLQHAADNVRGFCGRMEMKDCPESVKQQLALVKAGKNHPREFFLHLNEYSAHLQAVMNSLNHERNDGKILRGLCPADKWAQDNPQLPQFPDSAKYLYRSAYSVREVTRNGVRVSIGSGKYQQSYTYGVDAATGGIHPVLENHRGRRVIIFWNDNNPDTDAVIYSIRNGKPDQFLCVASRQQTIDRFGASGDEMKAEATRKKLSQQLAVSQSKSLAPFLQRRSLPSLQPPAPTTEISGRITAARERTEADQKSRRETAREVSRVSVSADDVRSALGTDVETTRPDMSAEEISKLFESPSRIENEEVQMP